MTSDDRAFRLAADQLARMRGMTRYYHERFFADVRTFTILFVALLVVGFAGVAEAFLLVPPLAILGGAQTAFDASYLIFARHYAARLERLLDEMAGRRVLVAARLEDRYLFPLGVRKVVTIPLGGPFTWFGFMTALYTIGGVIAALWALALGGSVLVEAGTGWTVAYVLTVGGLLLATLVAGVRWFVSGEGERRLSEVLDVAFPDA